MGREKATPVRALAKGVDSFHIRGLYPSVSPVSVQNTILKRMKAQTDRLGMEGASGRGGASSGHRLRGRQGGDGIGSLLGLMSPVSPSTVVARKTIPPSMAERDVLEGKPFFHPSLPGFDLSQSGHPLTQLQAVMTTAFLLRGEPLSFEELMQFVQPQWSRLRKRDGSPYNSDCKKALQANLRYHNPAIALFRVDSEQPDAWVLNRNGDKERTLAAVMRVGRGFRSMTGDGSTESTRGKVVSRQKSQRLTRSGRTTPEVAHDDTEEGDDGIQDEEPTGKRRVARKSRTTTAHRGASRGSGSSRGGRAAAAEEAETSAHRTEKGRPRGQRRGPTPAREEEEEQPVEEESSARTSGGWQEVFVNDKLSFRFFQPGPFKEAQKKIAVCVFNFGGSASRDAIIKETELSEAAVDEVLLQRPSLFRRSASGDWGCSRRLITVEHESSESSEEDENGEGDTGGKGEESDGRKPIGGEPESLDLKEENQVDPKDQESKGPDAIVEDSPDGSGSIEAVKESGKRKRGGPSSPVKRIKQDPIETSANVESGEPRVEEKGDRPRVRLAFAQRFLRRLIGSETQDEPRAVGGEGKSEMETESSVSRPRDKLRKEAESLLGDSNVVDMIWEGKKARSSEVFMLRVSITRLIVERGGYCSFPDLVDLVRPIFEHGRHFFQRLVEGKAEQMDAELAIMMILLGDRHFGYSEEDDAVFISEVAEKDESS